MNLTKQDDIYKFQSLMQAGDTVELDVQHHFSDGLYARGIVYSGWRLFGGCAA